MIKKSKRLIVFINNKEDVKKLLEPITSRFSDYYRGINDHTTIGVLFTNGINQEPNGYARVGVFSSDKYKDTPRYYIKDVEALRVEIKIQELRKKTSIIVTDR